MNLGKALKKVKKVNIQYFNRIQYFNYYKKSDIKSNLIFLEAQNAKNFNGNIYYLAKTLNNDSEYKKYDIYFSICKNKYEEAKKFFESKGINRIKLVKSKTRLYYKLLASAKYLFTDTSFDPCFIKKDGQVILNTWHGTPLKTLGKKVNNDFHSLGNVQKSLAMSDYLLYPNEYTMEHIVEDYMIANISDAKILLEGYPRNEVFFNEKLKEQVREKYNLKDKQVIAYMPTWRGTVSQVEDEKQQEILVNYLKQLDDNLKENQILYVNLHPFVGEKIDYSIFKNVKRFPKSYETYEFLSIADCLITDYSSVFFDFAGTKNKIIIFAYDEEDYLENRGLYTSLADLPFPKVSSIEDLIKEINTPKQYDDKEFIEKYCKYDNEKASKQLCDKVILGKNGNIVIKDLPKNGKENVLIFVGNLARNGITTSVKALLSNIDLEKRNYYINFRAREVKTNREVIKEFPEKINYMPMQGKMNLTLYQKIINLLYKERLVKDETYIKTMKDAFKDEIKRLFPNMKFNTAIQFCGYGYANTMLYSSFDCNKVIYVHNDMVEEINTKGNQRWGILNYAYNNYDKVALVTEDLLESTKQIAKNEDKCYISKNLIDYKNVLNLSKENIEFDEKTQCNIELEELKKILDDKRKKKIITIGRFSPEKAHIRLIDAFEKAWKKDNSIYLIIIGGMGVKYQETVQYAKKMKSKNHIVLIRTMSNPYTVLKRCNYFILPSLYEGFGLVIAEADVLGKPVAVTDITGPRTFMKEHGGTLIENSEEGVYKGIKMLLEDKIKPMNVDYEKYNQEAVQEFERLLNK